MTLLHPNRLLACLATILLFLPTALVWVVPVQAEGEDDPLWSKPNYEKKLYHVGQRLLNRNNITEKVAFRMFTDRAKQSVNAHTKEDTAQIVVTENLLHFIESDDELAAVLAHELGHVVLRHKTKRNHSPGYRLRTYLLSYPLGILVPYLGYEWGQTLNKRMAFSLQRQFELEADAAGIDYLAKAGYNPNALVVILLKVTSDGSKDDSMRSHPMATERIDAVQKKITEQYPQFTKPVEP